MTQQFHEGQEVEVEVCDVPASPNGGTWAHAKIVAAEIHRGALRVPTGAYIVQFPDGTRAVFNAGRIRAVRSAMESDGTAAELWPAQKPWVAKP